jgi:poly-gamma-glutamate synthesis protein (capsule biosynthesis protein)
MTRFIKNIVRGKYLPVVIIYGLLMAVFIILESVYVDEPIVENKPNSDTSVSVTPSETNNNASIIFVGDIMLSREVERKMKQNGWDYPFSAVTDFIKSADAVFGNLETPIIVGKEVKTSETTFRSDPEVAGALKRAGFSILSLANNHAMNFGAEGIKETFKYLNDASIAYVGAGNSEDEAYAPKYVEINGIIFGFLAFTDTDVLPPDSSIYDVQPGVAVMNVERCMEAVREAKAHADVLIVSIHSGTEYTDTPNLRQTVFAHAMIDEGADLIIGHHPHWVQSIEQYNGKYIFYSLGNFIFDQMWSKKTREGLAIKINFDKKGIIDYDEYPILIEDYSKPILIR